MLELLKKKRDYFQSEIDRVLKLQHRTSSEKRAAAEYLLVTSAKLTLVSELLRDSEGICDRCGGRSAELRDFSCGPCPEYPQGYGSQMELCYDCYVTVTEGLD